MQQIDSKNLLDTIEQYLEANSRLQSMLDELAEVYRLHTSSFQLLVAEMKGKCSVITALKWLMLIHRCYCKSQQHEILSNILNNVEPYATNSDFDKMLMIKLIKPYKVYLQKILITNLKDIQPELKAFTIINILNRALSFIDILYTFGRYYVTNYPFIIDFNINMGIDVAKTYGELIKHLNKQNIDILLYQIQRMHEKMYIVYYNCYFYKYLKKYIPKWICTELIRPPSSKSIKTISTNNSNFSQGNIANNMMAQSAYFSKKKNNPEMEESQMQVLKSMERVLSLFN